MRVVLATNEPWGTYHAAPLVDAAVEAGVELIQWVPDLERVPGDTKVAVSDKRSVLTTADLVVVNGLFTEHTLAAATAAEEASVPLFLSELAYLRAVPSTRRFSFTAVQATSYATTPVIGIHGRVSHSQVEVVGWPSLDQLPARQTQPGLIVGLTHVSEPTATGGHHKGDEHDLLYRSLEGLEQAGYEVIVRRHPRERSDRWSRWPTCDSCSTAEALCQAELVVGLAATPAFYTAAYQIPFLGILSPRIPDYIASCVTPLDWESDLLQLAEQAEPLSVEHREWICGPIGGAAERMVGGWLAAVS